MGCPAGFFRDGTVSLNGLSGWVLSGRHSDQAGAIALVID